MSRSTDEHGERPDPDALFVDSPLPTLAIDLVERRVVAANAATEALLGIPAAEIVGRPGSDFLVEPPADELLRRRGLSGETTRVVRQIRTVRGDQAAQIVIVPTSVEGTVYVQVVDGSPVSADPAGAVDASVAFDPVDAIIDDLAVAMLVVDAASGRVVRVNRSAERLYEASAATLLERDVDEVLAARDRPDAPSSHLRALSDHATTSLRVDVRAGSRVVSCEAYAVGVGGSTLVAIQLVPTASRRRRRPHRLAMAQRAAPVDRALAGPIRIGAGAALACLGAIVLVVGWWLGVDVVTRLGPNLVSMKANTAVGFFAFGLALLTFDRRRWALVHTVCLVLVVGLGAMTTLEYAVDADVGLDQLLVADEVDSGTAHAGRMGLNTAIAFVLMGVGLGSVRRVRHWFLVGQLSLLAAAGLAMLAFQAYVFGASGGRGLASATEMALHTSLAVMVGCAGTLVIDADRGLLAPVASSAAGGRFARRVLPIGFGIVVLAGLAVSVASNAGWLEDNDLRLAFLSVTILVAMFVAIVPISAQTNELDGEAEATRQDLAAVLAAFSDRHYRVDGTDVAHRVLGAGESGTSDVLDLVPPNRRARLVDAVARTRRDGVARDLSFTEPGIDRRSELRVARLPDGELAVSVRDVSDLAEARDELQRLTSSLEAEVRDRTAELRRANAELERSNRDLEHFAYLASHDLQEPLRMVSTFVDKLAGRLGDDLDERSRQYVDFAVDGAERMAELIDGLLQYSRAGRAELVPQQVAIGDVIDTVVRTLGSRVTDLGASIEVERPLPVVYADEVRLRQVVQNLLTNALKFVGDSTLPRIVVSAEHVWPTVLVSVTDNGIGIAPEFRESVFQMFRRLQSRGDYPGTGIGLALVRRLVESMHGKVWIDDAWDGPGTRVVMSFPAATAHPPTSNNQPTRS